MEGWPQRETHKPGTLNPRPAARLPHRPRWHGASLSRSVRCTLIGPLQPSETGRRSGGREGVWSSGGPGEERGREGGLSLCGVGSLRAA